MSSKIFIGDSREVLPTLYDEFAGRISLLVTSPPYFVGRGYEAYLDNEADYWNLINDVFTYVDLLVEPFGKIAINFADRYANAKEFGRQLEIPYAPKYHKLMEDKLSYDLWARIIWDKVGVVTQTAQHTTQESRFTGQMRVAPNWEYILVWRKYKPNMETPKKNIDMTKEEWTEWVNSIWRFKSVRKNEIIGDTKLAIFPDQLPYRLIKMYCVPRESQALTRTGWRFYNEINVGDELLTYNLSTRKLEWEEIKEIVTFPYNGQLLKIENSFVKYLFTPDHRWPIINRYEHHKVKRGYELNSSDRLIIAAQYKFPETSILNEREAAILGWIVTDGCVYWHTKNGPQVTIIQSKKKYHNEIRELLGDDCTSERHISKDNCFIFSIKAKLIHHIFDKCNYKNKPDFPSVVTRLNKQSAESMYKAMMMAEGHIEKGYNMFYQNHGPVLDGFQILNFLLGKSGNISKRGMYIKNSTGVKVYRALDTEWYTGTVWCPVTNNKTWVLRTEHGNVAISGNSQPNDIVIDPFCGTGTTIKMARQLGRIGIGIEKNPDMLETIQMNLQPDMFIADNVEYCVGG